MYSKMLLQPDHSSLASSIPAVHLVTEYFSILAFVNHDAQILTNCLFESSRLINHGHVLAKYMNHFL